MSVFVVMRVPGDPETLEQFGKNNAELLQRVAADGRAAGAKHHAFAAGDGEILVIDEWSDPQAFQKFFENQPDIPRIMAEGGAKGAPQISVYRKLDMPDAF